MMSNIRSTLMRWLVLVALVLGLLPASVLAAPALQAPTYPVPAVAIHVSELTQALEALPASPPTPTGAGTSGFQWWYTAWHYFVMYESLKEALRSDGTPFVTVSDANIAAGQLLNLDGSPKYPIVISLASEAIADTEVAPLRNYVAAGGFLFVGSSAFTRNPNGTTRGDFALANEMGLHMVNASLENWYQNTTFRKVIDNRLVSHIPSGTLTWRMPLYADQQPWIIFPTQVIHGANYVWQVHASDALVLANGDSGPLLAVKSYGQGQFIYHGALQPLIGHGGYDAGMYAYGIYRSAIDWAFEAAQLPIVSLSPWRYAYDAAFVVRHDFENTPSLIQSIEASAQAENAVGAKGDYYFTTGTVRDGSEDTQLSNSQKTQVIASLKRVVSLYGATIGSHNGGLKNPSNTSLSPSDYQYWHWGPDEALDTHPAGYTNGKAYAYTSIYTSFLDIQGWLAGYDNGRPGCGAAGNCPRTWVSPFFNSTREDSYDILAQLGSITMGEQKIGPFPHWTLSTQTVGKRYSHVTLPPSDWFIGSEVAQSTEEHTLVSVQALVDFYYNLGALINLYGHSPSNSGLQQQYVTYAAAKPRIWATNAVGVYDWWTARSNVVVTPTYGTSGDTLIAGASITGATDPQTAIEFVIPYGANALITDLFINGAPANAADYRTTDYGLKVRVGTSGSTVEMHYTYTYIITPTAGAGGNIMPGTPQTVTYGGERGFTITPSTGYHILDVRVDGGSVGAMGVYTFTNVTANHTITAAFAINTYALTVNRAGNGSGTITSNPAGINCGATCSANFNYNTVVTLTAAANTGSTFSGWGSNCAGTGTCSVTMSAARAVTGTFTLNTYGLTVNRAGSGSGTITSNPAGINCGATCSANFNYNTVVTLTAAANTGSTFTAWSGSGCAGTGTCSVTMSAARTVTGTFTLNTYIITPTAGAGGNIMPGTPQTVTYGGERGFTITPSTGYHILDVRVDGGSVGAMGVYTFTNVTANHTITAAFAINTYALTVNRAGNGSGTITSNPAGINCGATCSANFNYNTVVTLTAAANTGSTFSGWGSSCAGTGTCSVTMSAARAVTGTFTLNTYIITPTAGAGGSLAPGTPQTVNYGDERAFAITPNTGYHILDVGVDGGSVGAVGVYTFTNVTANHTITAAFALNTYTLTINTVGSGSVTKNPDQPTYHYGDVVTVTAVPEPFWAFAGWSGNLTGSDNPTSIVIDANKSITATFNATCLSITGADFNYTPLAPRVGQPVNFTAVITGGTAPITYTWNFGHGADVITTTGNVVHSFPLTTTVRSYPVTLTVANACSSHPAAPKSITVQPYGLYLPMIVR